MTNNLYVYNFIKGVILNNYVYQENEIFKKGYE